MKVRCPGCGKEYPAPALEPGRSVTVRCRACASMFRVSAPGAAPPAAPTAAARPAPPAAPAAPRASAARPAGPRPEGGGGAAADTLEPVFRLRGHSAPEPGAQVLIADESRPFRDLLAHTFASLGVKCAVVDDGESALRYVQEHRPRLLMVNVYLRRLLGIIVCERVKADPQLRSTRVVLIGALFRKDRFKREPDRLYGADDYIEESITPEALKERMGGLFEPVSAGAPASETAGGGVSEELQRLTRIILSDILLYNPERCDAAVREGRFEQEFQVELEEGRRLVLDRFPGQPRAIEAYRRLVQEWAEEQRGALAS